MTTVPFGDSVKTGLLASGWYANRLSNDVFPGVLTLCYHGVRASANEDDACRLPTCTSSRRPSTRSAG